MIQAVETLAPPSNRSACEAVGLRAGASIGRNRRRTCRAQPGPERPPSPRALTPTEKATVREVLNSERFQIRPPAKCMPPCWMKSATYARGARCIGFWLKIRRFANAVTNCTPGLCQTERLATHPNQLWSWDITKLRGPVTWTYYYLYVILDVYSRYVVGWMIAERESEELAQELIRETCAKQGIQPGQLTLHADNGSAMIAKSVAQLLIDLEVVKSHSRPHVSDDNPYSEAQFKTLKYRPDYPERFGCLADARAWAQAFFAWYNQEHHHTGLDFSRLRSCITDRRRRCFKSGNRFWM